MKVRIGRVRANDKLSVHLSIDNVTCDKRRPVNVETTTRNATAANANLCKRCFTPARIELAQQRAMSGSFDVKTDNILFWAREQLQTPAQRAAADQFAADVREHLAAVDMPAMPVRGLSELALAGLRAGGTPRTAQHVAPKPAGRTRTKRRLAIHNGFARTAA